MKTLQTVFVSLCNADILKPIFHVCMQLFSVCVCVVAFVHFPASFLLLDPHILESLAKQAILIYTPSRKIKGKRMMCYDDRYIVKLAYEQDGVIVSNDNFRDLQNENPEWKWFIEQRLLMYSFVNDK